MIDDFDGYTYSEQILTSSNETMHPAFFAAKNYNVSIPERTSGWYLPSMGQLAALINNLGIADGATDFTAGICTEKGSQGKYDKTNGAPDAIAKLNEIFTKVGGSLRTEMAITESGWNLRWWGCGQTKYNVNSGSEETLSDYIMGWCVDMNYGDENDGSKYAKYLFLSRKKTDNTAYNRVRPVFAF